LESLENRKDVKTISRELQCIKKTIKKDKKRINLKKTKLKIQI
jgi:hypothetical protein